jgi:putative endonuclease
LSTREKGAGGEDTAANHLISLGYCILTRNYQTRHGEIDCIARDIDGTLVFIEVKLSRQGSLISPLWRVTRAKQHKLALMARSYLADHSISGTACRFDVIGITGNRIEHLRNAFLV